MKFVTQPFAANSKIFRYAFFTTAFIFAAILFGAPAKALAQTACAAAWNSTTAYTGGQTASYNNVNYTANWWTQGNNPSTSNGGSGSGQPWTSNGACGGSGSGGGNGTSAITPGATYNLFNPESGANLDVAGCGTANGSRIQIWKGADGVCNGGAGQIWQADLNSDGTYTFVNPESGGALDVAGCGTANGNTIQLWAAGVGVCNGGAGQKWSIQANSNGTYTLVNPESNGALDIAGCGTADGSTVQLWANGVGVCNSGAGQQWQFVPATAGSGGGTPPPSRLYAPYVDMGMTASAENLMQIQQAAGFKGVTLAFLTSTNGCSVGWGGVGGTLPTDTQPNGTSILSIVQSLQAAGVQVIISFGGAVGSEPALTCTNATQLQALYQSVLDRYHVTMLDFDIEGSAPSNQASLTLRDQALRGLKAANPGLIISYTLPVMPTGLIASGVNVLNSAKADGLDLDVVNGMTMDFGAANDNGGQMGLDAENAAANINSQIAAAGLTSSVGVTPMIGVNDTNTEIFQLSDATSLLNFANSNSYISRIADWSLTRDNGSCPGQTWASASCSGIAQSTYQFSSIWKAY